MSDHEWSGEFSPWPGEDAVRDFRCIKCGEALVPEGWEGSMYDTSHRLRSGRDCPEPMSRKQAISHIWGLESAVDQEFSVSAAESAAGKAETRGALVALGVRPDEL